MSENGEGAWPGHLSISATEATKAVEAIQFLWSLDTGTGTVAPTPTPTPTMCNTPDVDDEQENVEEIHVPEDLAEVEVL